MNAKALSILLACTVAFTFLFYQAPFGINILLLTIVLLSGRIVLYRNETHSAMSSITTAALLISALSVMYHGSSYAVWVYFLSMASFVGAHAYDKIKSLHWAFLNGIWTSIRTPFVLKDAMATSQRFSPRLLFSLKKTYISIIPILIIYVFLLIYRSSNALFDERVHALGLKFSTFFQDLFSHLDLNLFITLMIGLSISTAFLFPRIKAKLKKKSDEAEYDLVRSRTQSKPAWGILRFTLKDELKSGLFLFATLNLILLALNISDIATIWTGYEWNGELLRTDVHRATYLLIVSILLSMALVLYYFRGNLNFYKKNRVLKALCYLWLAQNAFLALSVLMRNSIYISHYNLAYKRIGVIFFIALCLLGLALIVIKIMRRKTGFYLISRMSLAICITLVISAIPNWDRIIARYNLAHSDSAFIHFDFMVQLSDGSLDLLDVPLETLQEMKVDQTEKFYSRSFYTQHSYMDAARFKEVVDNRIQDFIEDYPERSWKGWNYSDYTAYLLLSEKNSISSYSQLHSE